jgi:hypothetical protein
MKVFDLRFFLGRVEGLLERILADRLTVACEYDTGAVKAG